MDHQRALVMRATTVAAPTRGRAAVWRIQIAQLELTLGGGLKPGFDRRSLAERRLQPRQSQISGGHSNG